MRRLLRQAAIPAVLLSIKLLTVARMAADTYAISGDWLAVLLIDGVLLAFWLAAAYAGDGKSALAIRPYAVIGAWLLYASQLYIGWEAHHHVVAIIARLAGGLALAYDTWAYVAALWRSRPRQTRAVRRAGWRGLAFDAGYLLFTAALLPLWLLASGVSVLVDMARDLGVAIVPASQHVTVLADGAPDDRTPVLPLADGTTARREAVRRGLADGLSQSALALALDVSPRTISRDVAALRQARE